VLELVLEDSFHGGAEGAVLVPVPDGQVLPHAVDLDGLEDDVDGRRAEDPAGEHERPEADPTQRVERGDVLEIEEGLPEVHVARLDDDQLVEHGAKAARRHVAQGSVEGEVEDLVEDELAAETEIGGCGHEGPPRRTRRRTT
jgi:hypothetical protein